MSINNIMNKFDKYLVVYIFSNFDDINRFKNFINSYKNYPSGYPHKLIICFKLLDKTKLELCRSIASSISYEEFIDPIQENDFEFKLLLINLKVSGLSGEPVDIKQLIFFKISFLFDL